MNEGKIDAFYKLSPTQINTMDNGDYLVASSIYIIILHYLKIPHHLGKPINRCP